MDTLSRIIYLLEQSGHTQSELTEFLGIKKSAFTDWKAGKSKSYIKYAPQIASYFDVSVDSLFGKDTLFKAKTKTPAVTVYDEHDNIIRLDNETLELIDSLRTRPEMKMMFSMSKNATKEDIIKAVKIIEALKDESEGK